MTRVRAATFIVLEEVDKAEVKEEEEDKNEVEHHNVNMGIFFTASRAVTANHNFPPEWAIGKRVSISFPGMTGRLFCQD